MTKYFRNVKSLDDLKEQFKTLAKKNHPDAGGDAEIMKEINAEYDALFPVWKHRYNQTADTPTAETANSTRYSFYTQNGWAGSKYKPHRSTKEITALVRAYIKEVYPTYRFSVRFSTASMCSEIYIELTQAPKPIYKKFDDLTEDEVNRAWGKSIRSGLLTGNDAAILDDTAMLHLKQEYEKNNFLKVMYEDVDVMFKDIDREVSSYRYSDCDGMIDYFSTNFYWFGVSISNKFKIVEKAARVNASKKANTVPAEQKFGHVTETDAGQLHEKEFEITETEHTKTHEKIFVVKVLSKLSREEYLKTRDCMKGLGGYYSKYVHGFVFHDDPTDALSAQGIA